MMTMTMMNTCNTKMMGLEGACRAARRSSFSAVLKKIAASFHSIIQSGSETRGSAVRNDSEEMLRRISLAGWTACNNMTSRQIY